jgi:predicted HTH transcriptional regulator
LALSRGVAMTLIDPPVQQITIEDLQQFLDGAEAELLLWEAKGTTLHKDGVRKAICGFANGRETAYLILGAEEKDGGGWTLGGVDLGGDPPAWVSGVVGEGLRPVPLVDVRSLSTGNGTHVAIVEVPPIAVPPCISRGTVYERVSGRTIPIADPKRLAELYECGRNAHDTARSAARGAAIRVIEDPDGPGAGRDSHG